MTPDPQFAPNSHSLREAATEGGAKDTERWLRIQASDHTAFEALFRAYHPSMCSFAARMVSSSEIAEDLVQEVFLYIWRHRESVQMRMSPRVYLYSALRHAALRYLRHERVEKRHTAETISIFDRPPRSTDARLLSAETLSLVRAAISRLPERCRLVYTLHREQGLSYAEVAEVMEISPKTVDVQMGRALKSLRRALGSHR